MVNGASTIRKTKISSSDGFPEDSKQISSFSSDLRWKFLPFWYFPLILRAKIPTISIFPPHLALFPTIMRSDGRKPFSISPPYATEKIAFLPPPHLTFFFVAFQEIVAYGRAQNGGEISKMLRKMLREKWQCYGSCDFPPILRGLGGEGFWASYHHMGGGTTHVSLSKENTKLRTNRVW